MPPFQEYFVELRKVSKNQIVWGVNHFIEKIPINSSCWLVWDKLQPHNFILATAELACTSFKKPVKKYHCRLMKEKRIHPTQKQVKFYSWLLENYAKSGQRIFDMHFDLGWIAIACHYAKLHLIASEIDLYYFTSDYNCIDNEIAQESFCFMDV